jgi:hypothetical protein
MKYWACSHIAAEASQLQQDADALLNLAVGSVSRRNGAAGASNVPRLMARFEGDMEVDEEKLRMWMILENRCLAILTKLLLFAGGLWKEILLKNLVCFRPCNRLKTSTSSNTSV